MSRDTEPRVLTEVPCPVCVRTNGDIIPAYRFSCHACEGSRLKQTGISLSELRVLLERDRAR